MSVGYDLIAIDLDGTLLRRDGSVSARNVAALREARDAGAEVVLATGRALIESDHVLDHVGREGFFVGAGGAMLCNARTGRTVQRSDMDEHLVRAVTASLNRHGHLAHLLKDGSVAGYDYLIVGDGVLDPATQWWFDTLPIRARFARLLEEDEHPELTVRVGTVASARELDHVEHELREDLGDTVFLQHWAAVTSTEATGSQTHLLEVFNPEVDKWTMIRRIAERRGIDRDRVAAIGDGLNDIRMVREAGLGVAIGNAEAGVMHVADRVAPENDEDGVAVAIDAILHGKW